MSKKEYEGLIGNRVRILNPGRDKSDIGYVHSVGKIYVTVSIPGGIKKLRIAKNLRLLIHESAHQKRGDTPERDRK